MSHRPPLLPASAFPKHFRISPPVAAAEHFKMFIVNIWISAEMWSTMSGDADGKNNSVNSPACDTGDDGFVCRWQKGNRCVCVLLW